MDNDDRSRVSANTPPQFDSSLTAGFNQIAAARKRAQQAGQPLPDDLRREIYAMREMLRENGLTEDQINATPGLEPPG